MGRLDAARARRRRRASRPRATRSAGSFPQRARRPRAPRLGSTAYAEAICAALADELGRPGHRSRRRPARGRARAGALCRRRHPPRDRGQRQAPDASRPPLTWVETDSSDAYLPDVNLEFNRWTCLRRSRGRSPGDGGGRRHGPHLRARRDRPRRPDCRRSSPATSSRSSTRAPTRTRGRRNFNALGAAGDRPRRRRGRRDDPPPRDDRRMSSPAT